MTATDELRKLLDERGVEHNDGESMTYVMDADFMPDYGDTFTVTLYERTPAQAVEATLGRGECHNVSEVVDEHGQARFACSECPAWMDSRLLWNPEYRNGESPWVKDCKLNFCPNCGRRIMEVD